MAAEPTKQDLDKLDAKIKELTKRADEHGATVDDIHTGAQDAKAVSQTHAKALDEINKKGAAADKDAARRRK